MDAIVTFEDGARRKMQIYVRGGKRVYADTIGNDFMRGWNADPNHANKILKVKVFRTGSITLPNEIRQQLSL